MVIPLFSESIYPPLIAAVSPWLKKFPLFNSTSPEAPVPKRVLAHHESENQSAQINQLYMPPTVSELTAEIPASPERRFYPAPNLITKREKQFAVLFPEH